MLHTPRGSGRRPLVNPQQTPSSVAPAAPPPGQTWESCLAGHTLFNKDTHSTPTESLLPAGAQVDRPRCGGPRPPAGLDPPPGGWSSGTRGGTLHPLVPKLQAQRLPLSVSPWEGKGLGTLALSGAHAPEDGGGCPPAERGLPPHHCSQAPICSLVLCRRKERAQLRGQGALGRKLHPSPASVVLIRERGTSKCGRLASSKRVRGICSPFTVARLTVPEVGPARVSGGQRVNKAGPPRRGDTTRPPGQGV